MLRRRTVLNSANRRVFPAGWSANRDKSSHRRGWSPGLSIARDWLIMELGSALWKAGGRPRVGSFHPEISPGGNIGLDYFRLQNAQ
jgi:hypothetical protein